MIDRFRSPLWGPDICPVVRGQSAGHRREIRWNGPFWPNGRGTSAAQGIGRTSTTERLSDMDLQSRLTDFAMNGAEWVMWLLVALSIIGFAIATERAFALVRSRDHVGALGVDMMRFLRRGEIDAAKARLARSPSFEARVVGAGLA